MNTNQTIGIVVVVLLLIVGGFWIASSRSDEKTEYAADNKVVVTDTTPKNDSHGGDNMQGGGVVVGGQAMLASRDIVDNASNASNLTTLVAAVKAAGLVATLKSAGPFTVFAPTNAAFAKLPAGTVDTLLKPENKAMLVKILTYHVVPGRHTKADLLDGMILKTVEGDTIKITKDTNGGLKVNGVAMVETADVIDSNGVSFVIDSVLLPPTASSTAR